MSTEVEEIILKVRAESDLKTLNKDLTITNRKLTKTSKLTDKINKRFAKIGAIIASAVAIKKLIELGREAIRTSREFERMGLAMETVFGRKAATNILFIRREAERLGIDVLQASKGFVQLSAATKGILTMRETKDLFTATAEASTALGLTADKTGRLLTALSQIASKGTLSAEELRQQMGEHLPGAFQIAADSMGVTTKELNKLLETGKISAQEFLPAFAKQLSKTFHGGAMANANSEIADATRNMNKWNSLLSDMGGNLKFAETAGFMLFLSFLEDFTPFESGEKVLKELEEMNKEVDKIQASTFRKQTIQSPLEKALFNANELMLKFRQSVIEAAKEESLRKSLGLTALGYKHVKEEIDAMMKSAIPQSEVNKNARELVNILKEAGQLTDSDIIKTDDVKKAEKIKEMMDEWIGNDFLQTLESAGVDIASMGQVGNFGAAVEPTISRGSQTGLEVGTAEAAKFLSRPVEEQTVIEKQQLSALEEIAMNTKTKPVILLVK